MRAFDAVVITSRREQLPTVLLEALGASVPVVSVGVGDVPLFARAGVAVTARDPDAIAGALTRLTACDAARRRLGAAGAAYVREHHDSARWADRHTALYSAHATPPRRIAS
jgi:glycosyltransferase involved in cell wall biosynthesis